MVLTNADVDHIAGLLTLREKTPFVIHATAETLSVLAANTVFGVLDPALVDRRTIMLGAEFSPVEGLTVTAFAVPGKVALYLEGDAPQTNVIGEQTIALRISDGAKRLYYVPGCADIPDWLVTQLSDGDLVLFDGTVWADDEMAVTGTGGKTGGRMGHIAMSGDTGSLVRLAGLTDCRKVYVHINNTNPVLQPDSPERAEVSAHGWTVAQDGLEFRL